jgi:long-chain acyl-CoA synthetase
MFSCGGENIYPKEVENLLFTHPDVANAVVAPVPHRVKGFVPAAMVVPRAGAAPTAAEIRAYCLHRGPLYAHPRHIEIVRALPLNGAGKIDRAVAQALLRSAYERHGPAEAQAADT